LRNEEGRKGKRIFDSHTTNPFLVEGSIELHIKIAYQLLSGVSGSSAL
jgi:hypothetical protein